MLRFTWVFQVIVNNVATPSSLLMMEQWRVTVGGGANLEHFGWVSQNCFVATHGFQWNMQHEFFTRPKLGRCSGCIYIYILYTYSKYIYIYISVKTYIFHVHGMCNIYVYISKCLVLSCSRDFCLSQKHWSPKFPSSKSQIDPSDESWKAITWKGPGLFSTSRVVFSTSGVLSLFQNKLLDNAFCRTFGL